MSQTTARAESTQALVVGGGLAGLYAAWQLKKAGTDCLLLEAAPRLGGRILSQPIAPGSPLGVDLGPMWFWPHQKRLQRLCQELGLPTFEQPTNGNNGSARGTPDRWRHAVPTGVRQRTATPFRH